MDYQGTILKTTASFPLQFAQQRQEKISFKSQEFCETKIHSLRGIEEDKQFVFHGQCMVLGDSGVGKTSLVKSLTGKPFDPRQTKTQGVKQSLVDEKWNSLNMKELVFGDLWRFLEFVNVEVSLIGTGAATSNVVVDRFTMLKYPSVFFLPLLLCLLAFAVALSLTNKGNGGFPLVYSMYFVEMCFPTFAFYFARNQFGRVTLATFNVIVSRRGLIIGSYIALVMCYLDETKTYKYAEFVSSRAVFLLVTITGIGSTAFFRFMRPRSLSFGKLTMMIVCCFRFLLSTFTGLIFGFAAASLGNENSENSKNDTSPFVRNVAIPFAMHFPHEFVELTGSLKFFSSIFDGSWEPYVLLIVVMYYLLKLAWISKSFCFAIFFPLFVLLSFVVELFRFHEIIPFNFEYPNKLITQVIGEGGMTDDKMLKRALNAKFSSLKLKILDFAGDKEYYAYHHMFLRSNAIQVIVFNMMEFVKEDFRGISAGIRRLQFWLESVCSHGPQKAPVFLVGTHRGTIDKKCMKMLNRHLRRYVWNPYCDELVVNNVEDLIFFPVENSEGQNDIGVQKLQKEIVSVSEQCKETIGGNIPLTWIRIQDAIISLQEKKEATFCVTLAEIPRAFDNFVCNGCSKETLKYFHEKGLVIYLDRNQNVDLSNWVLLKPEILVEIIIQLVTPPPENTQQRGLRNDWKLLQEKGMLTKSLLKSIISKVQENEEAMTAFLEEYDLICPLLNKKVQMYRLHDQYEKQPTHFVPSLLPMSGDGDLPVWHGDDDADKKFYVFFDRFLPHPLFHRLLSRAHKNSKVEFPNGQTVLYRDAGKFWMTRWQPYRLKLMKGQKMIEVTFSYSTNCGMKPSDVLCQVFSMVDGICKRCFPYIKFHCGPACPSQNCPGHQDDFLSSYPPAVDRGTRRHVYDVMPGRQRDRIAFLYCENHSFEQVLDEWIP